MRNLHLSSQHHDGHDKATPLIPVKTGNQRGLQTTEDEAGNAGLSSCLNEAENHAGHSRPLPREADGATPALGTLHAIHAPVAAGQKEGISQSMSEDEAAIT